jgi:hypothetical protein
MKNLCEGDQNQVHELNLNVFFLFNLTFFYEYIITIIIYT